MEEYGKNSPRDNNVELDTSVFFDAFFHNALNTSILILDTNGIIIDFNDKFHQLSGYSKHDIVGKSFSMLFIPEDRDRKLPEKELETVMNEGAGSNKSFLLNNNGKYIWVVGESVLVKSKDQSYILKLVYDINEEKKIAQFLAKANDQLIESTNYAKDVNRSLSKANDDLKRINREVDQLSKKNVEQTEFYEMLLSNTADFIYSFDLEGRFTYVNKALLDLWEIKLEDAIGKSFHDLEYPSDVADKHQLQIQKVIKTRKPIRDENFYTSKLGKRYYEYIFVPIMEGERVTAVAGTTRDITHRINLIRELKMKNEELSRINLDLDNFVYTASHDLKAPINNIHALIRFLEEDMTPESKKNSGELLELIYSSIEKFQNTLTDLSTVVRESAGEEGVIKEVWFNEVIDDVTTNLYQVIERTGAKFTLDLKGPVIHFPKKNLRSIIFNLVSNAIKYRAPDRKPEIKISTEKLERYILLKVSDNGLGIKEEDKAKVFKMFNRLHDHVEGTGVGMAIVSRIVDTAGGKIEIDSEIGKGTTFKVYFKV